jgi:hypothetical protein
MPPFGKRKARKRDKNGKLITYSASDLYINGQRIGSSKVNFEVAEKAEPEKPSGIASRFANIDMDDEPEVKPRARSKR